MAVHILICVVASNIAQQKIIRKHTLDLKHFFTILKEWKIPRAPPWVNSGQALSHRLPNTQSGKLRNIKNMSPPWFPSPPPPNPKVILVGTGNATHGWPYMAARKLLIWGFKAAFHLNCSSPPHPLLRSASCLCELIFHTGERPTLLAPQRPFPSMTS